MDVKDDEISGQQQMAIGETIAAAVVFKRRSIWVQYAPFRTESLLILNADTHARMPHNLWGTISFDDAAAESNGTIHV